MTDIAHQLGAKGQITLHQSQSFTSPACSKADSVEKCSRLGGGGQLCSISKAVFEAAGEDFGPPLPPQRRIGKKTMGMIQQMLKDNDVYSVLEIPEARQEVSRRTSDIE